MHHTGGMMSTVSLRIDSDLTKQAEREARIKNRSKAKQIEYWAKLGRAISSKLSLSDAFAVAQGIKELKLEIAPSLKSPSIDSRLVFDDLERDRQKGTLPDKVTSARVFYEASHRHEGFLDRVDAVTGERQTGQFENGIFKVF